MLEKWLQSKHCALLKIVLDNWLSIQIFTSTPKFLQRGDHIWPKFEKQVKPLGFLKKPPKNDWNDKVYRMDDMGRECGPREGTT